jgi:hypothetical protein
VGQGAPLRRSDRHRHRLPRGRPAARALHGGLCRGEEGGPEDHRARRRIRHALDQRAHRARRAAGGPHRPRLHGGRPARLRAPVRRARRALHRGAHQLVLPAHAAARALGPGPPDPPHARPRPAHPPQHRRPDAAQGHAHRGVADDGARLRLRPGRPARLHAQRPRWRMDRRHAAPRMAHAMERGVRHAARPPRHRTHAFHFRR